MAASGSWMRHFPVSTSMGSECFARYVKGLRRRPRRVLDVPYGGEIKNSDLSAGSVTESMLRPGDQRNPDTPLVRSHRLNAPLNGLKPILTSHTSGTLPELSSRIALPPTRPPEPDVGLPLLRGRRYRRYPHAAHLGPVQPCVMVSQALNHLPRRQCLAPHDRHDCRGGGGCRAARH